MSPPAEIQPRPDERERVVDGLALDDAVQIEHDGRGAEEHASAKRERFEGRNAHRLDRVAVEGERGEIAVVAGGEQGATDGRGHETAGGASCAECQVEHRRELLGDERHAGGCGVDARELRVREEAGEAAVARIEELADRLDRHAGADGDLTAHRPERAHEPPLWTEGTLFDGPIEPLPKSKVGALCESSSYVAVDGAWVAVLVPGWAARATRAKTANPATAAAPRE